MIPPRTLVVRELSRQRSTGRETIQLPMKVDDDFVTPIYGDSLEPDYKSRDYVFVKLTVELPSETVGVFDYEG